MKALNKFFTPPLSVDDESTLHRMLGFEKLRTLVVERSGEQILFSHLYNFADESVASLFAADIPHWLNEHQIHQAVILDHQSGRLSRVECPTPQTSRTLWEVLTPFPLSLLRTPRLPGRSFEVTILPETSAQKMGTLLERVASLQSLMMGFEVSVLWIRAGEARLPVLFHFVRGRMVRVGTSPRLYELGYRYDSGELTEEYLTQTMGTRTTLIPLILPSEAENHPDSALDSLATALQGAIEGSIQPPSGISGLPETESRL